MTPSSQSRINSIRKLNNIVVSRLTHLCPSVISNRWRHNTSQDWEYLAKNYENFTTALIPDETLLRLGLHISSTGYLRDGALRFTKVTENKNTSFDRKVVEDEDGKEDGEEAVTDSEEEASKKRARRKAKRKAARAQTLLFGAVLGLSAPASAFVPVPGLSTTVPGSSAPTSASVPVPGSSAAVAGSSAVMLELSAALPGSSIAVFTSIPVLGLSATVPLSVPMLPGLSPLPFLALSLPKTPTPNLAVGRQRLDDTISGWSGRSKRASQEELCSGRIKRAASKEAFSPKALLFLLLFPFSSIDKRKLNKTFINNWLLADNYAKEEVDPSFAACGCPPAVKLNRPWQI